MKKLIITNYSNGYSISVAVVAAKGFSTICYFRETNALLVFYKEEMVLVSHVVEQ